MDAEMRIYWEKRVQQFQSEEASEGDGVWRLGYLAGRLGLPLQDWILSNISRSFFRFIRMASTNIPLSSTSRTLAKMMPVLKADISPQSFHFSVEQVVNMNCEQNVFRVWTKTQHSRCWPNERCHHQKTAFWSLLKRSIKLAETCETSKIFIWQKTFWGNQDISLLLTLNFSTDVIDQVPGLKCL